MHFVKSGLYLQKITKSGITEQEIDTRDPKDREHEERLRKLPEFTNDPSYKSLAEQLEENEDGENQSFDPSTGYLSNEKAYFYAPPKMTREEAEFLDSIHKEKLMKARLIGEEEEREIRYFRKYLNNPNTAVSTASRTHSTIEEELGKPTKTSLGIESFPRNPLSEQKLKSSILVIKKQERKNAVRKYGESPSEKNILTHEIEQKLLESEKKKGCKSKNPLNSFLSCYAEEEEEEELDSAM